MKEGLKGCVAEFLATTTFFFLVYVLLVKVGTPNLAGLVVGGSLAVTVLAFGVFKAAHINPAVTLGMMIAGRTPWHTGLLYWIAQCAGSVVGLMLAGFVLTQSLATNFAWQFIVRPADGLADWKVMALEAIAAFFLTLAVAVATDEKAKKGADWLIIGGTLGVFVWLISNLTGAAINPVRALGPWVLVRPENGLSTTLLSFVVATLAGGFVAGLFYRTFKSPSPA